MRVQVEEPMPSPVNTLAYNCSEQFGSNGGITQFGLPGGNGTARPTSAVCQFASATPVEWTVAAYSAGERTYISRPVLTCGNTVTIRVRNASNSPFSQPDADLNNVRWVISSTGAGRCTGTVFFSRKGELTPNVVPQPIARRA